MCDFVHLHVHSEYSLLDGLNKTSKLAKTAKSLNQKALAITDHGVMHGVIDFFRDCKKNDIKPIIGTEMYITHFGKQMNSRDANERKSHHLLLLAENQIGYKNLLKICSDAQLKGFYYNPRIDFDYLATHSEGLICTTGCMAAEIPFLLSNLPGSPANIQLAEKRLMDYVDLFSRDKFYIELQHHELKSHKTDDLKTSDLILINKQLIEWSKKHNIKIIVTNDVHYASQNDSNTHDDLLCVQTGKLKVDEGRMSTDGSYYLKSYEEMKKTMSNYDIPESAFTNTIVISEMCNVELEDSSFHLPELPYTVISQFDTENKDCKNLLRTETEKGLVKRYGIDANSDIIVKRKELELSIINSMNFDVYFLIVWDLCRYAKENNIWWNIRGSGAGSIVAYALGITLIDPLKNGLIFERFLNPSRISMPDFDIDFADDKRTMMIKYAIDTYGVEHVAQIVSFGQMKSRSAIKDVGKIHNISTELINKVVNEIPITSIEFTISDLLDINHSLYSSKLSEIYHSDISAKILIDNAMSLEGVIRHTSIHAAAVVITDKPVTEYAPLMRPIEYSLKLTDDKQEPITFNIPVTQFEYTICESIGLLKFDFLGSATLQALNMTSKEILRNYGIQYNIENIIFDDFNWKPIDKRLSDNHLEKAYQLLRSGDTAGIFQVESDGMNKVLTEMQPTRFEHIVAAVSLYRPGPLEYIPTYIKRMHGREDVVYKHQLLEPILKETYGIIIYQEQIIQIAVQLAGYTPGEADQIRKAIGKKIKAKIDEHKSKFIEGCLKNNINTNTASDIWSDIETFANYGFNKSHASDYAMITVITAYMKANYPLEYMTSLLSVYQHNPDKLRDLLNNCRMLNIKVLLPNIITNNTENFSIENGMIRCGIKAIKDIGEVALHKITHNKFKTLDDVGVIGKKALESLIKTGALDCFSTNREWLLDNIDKITNSGRSNNKSKNTGQNTFFGNNQELSIFDNIPEQKTDIKTKLKWEKELLGAFISPHPMQEYEDILKANDFISLGDIDKSKQNKSIKVAGLITKITFTKTKDNQEMAFVAIEDTYSSKVIIIFPNVYKICKSLIVENNIIVVSGIVDSSLKIKANTISDKLPTEYPKIVHKIETQTTNKILYIKLKVTDNIKDDIDKLRTIFFLLTSNPGNDEFRFHIGDKEILFKERINISDFLVNMLIQLIQKSDYWIIDTSKMI